MALRPTGRDDARPKRGSLRFPQSLLDESPDVFVLADHDNSKCVRYRRSPSRLAGESGSGDPGVIAV
jgi:hypothetical protein